MTEDTNQSKKILEIQQSIFALSSQRTELATSRTALAATRTYLSAERTLSVWIRTSLAAMVFGIAIDRFGLMFGTPKSILLFLD